MSKIRIQKTGLRTLLSGRKRHPSIRYALILVVCLAMAPALGIIIITGLEYSHAIAEKAMSDSARQVEAFSQIQIRMTESTKQILATLTALPRFRELQYDVVSEMLRMVQKENPEYLNFTVVNIAGIVVASSLLPLGLDLSDRFHFREAIDRDRFSTGKYMINMIDATPAIAYTYPCRNMMGVVAGALAVVIKLDRYDDLFEEMRLPQDSVLGLLDADGRLLYYYPPKESNPVGAPIKAGIWSSIGAGGDSGTFVATGSDQVERYYSYRKLRLESARQPYMYVVFGEPVETTDSKSRMVMGRNLLLMFAVLLFGLSTAGLLSRLLFGKRLDRIIATTTRLREGNLAARTGLDEDRSDLGQIAMALDQMASTIETREQERVEHAKALSTSLAEKEVLLKEVHHRVKNNLQLIQSLLVLQSESPDDIVVFEERMSSRIRAMSMVHQMLYESEHLSVVDLGAYARQLVELAQYSMQGVDEVDVTMETAEVPSDIDTAIPFGLLLNELLTNAWRHALGTGKGKSLHIALALHNGKVTLEVCDDGPGMPAGFSISETSSLGLRLALALASQLHGTLTFTSSPKGTTFKVVFPQDRS